MKSLQVALMAGAAALAAAGTATLARARTATLARARTPDSHVLTIQLPDGSTEQIRYSGNVPPRVALLPMPGPLSLWAPGFDQAPFAALDRMAAQMNREAEAMLREAQALALQPLTGPNQLTTAGFGSLPAGSQSYRMVATMSGQGVCTRSVTITAQASGAPPRVISQQSGACGPQGGAAVPVAHPAPWRQPLTIRVAAPPAASGTAARPIPVVW